MDPMCHAKASNFATGAEAQITGRLMTYELRQPLKAVPNVLWRRASTPVPSNYALNWTTRSRADAAIGPRQGHRQVRDLVSTAGVGGCTVSGSSFLTRESTTTTCRQRS